MERNKLNRPEKSESLERLAEAELPVPEIRVLFEAEAFEGDEVPSEVSTLEEKAVDGDFVIMVRSAHPMESEFGGGAFESYAVRIKQGDSAEVVWGKICSVRARIMEEAKPENSLQIRRNIKFGEIENFDPGQMGVFVNEKLESERQITVVPIADGKVSLRYILDDNHSGPSPGAVEIDLHHPDCDSLEKMARVRDDWGRHKMIIKDLDQFVSDLKNAQSLLGGEQEMEIHLSGDGDYYFVQSKNTVTEDGGEIVDDKEFERGVKTYFREEWDFGYGSRVTHVAGDSNKFMIWRARVVDEVRNTRALVIDELDWVRESKMRFRYRPEGLNSAANKLARDYSPPILDRETYGSNPTMREKRDKLQNLMLAKYAELMQLAEDYPEYTFIVLNF
ncbi:hypothetical protein JKY72_03360, partial [Candidatus Gracilibacteria bacterium]|nr:hypothetical protein [Candidatus Gracilibacteria bacterium]